MEEKAKSVHRLTLEMPSEYMPTLKALKRDLNVRTYRSVIVKALRLLAIFLARKNAGHIIYTIAPDGRRTDFEIL